MLLGARSDTIEGIAPGVRVRPAWYAPFVETVLLEIPCTQAQAQRFWAFLEVQLGKPYDKRAIWGFALGRDWREPDSWICSELQAAALEAACIAPRLYLRANKITPVALALAVSALGGRVIEHTRRH